MDVLEAVRTRRVIRRFADRPLDEAHLDAILDAGRKAGSSKNQQRWAFIVVRDRQRLQELSTLGPYAGHIAGAAAAIALVTPDPRPGPNSIMWDLGGAAALMMLAGWSLGIGSCPATVYEPAKAQAILGYPDGQWCEYILSFGYPADPADLDAPPRAGGRRGLDDVAHEERW
jgi:nitroreductase